MGMQASMHSLRTTFDNLICRMLRTPACAGFGVPHPLATNPVKACAHNIACIQARPSSTRKHGPHAQAGRHPRSGQ
eukprot:15464955-Alexandrium_andersonii.AAC.1